MMPKNQKLVQVILELMQSRYYYQFHPAKIAFHLTYILAWKRNHKPPWLVGRILDKRDYRPIPELKDDFQNLTEGKEASFQKSLVIRWNLVGMGERTTFSSLGKQVKATSLLFSQLEVKKARLFLETW